jgi:hypothetical protein
MRRQRWSYSRREVLGRLGLGLGWLPLLQATRSYAASPLAPRRLVCVVQPFGYRRAGWLPSTAAPLAATPLPDATRPLEPYKDALIFLPDLTNPGPMPCRSCNDGAYGTVFSGVAAAPPSSASESGGPSVDQVVAAAIAKNTALPLRSLPLGVMVDNGGLLPRSARRCFWRGANQPVDPEESPHALFASLFSGPAGGDAARRLQLEQKSVLDYVSDELDRWKARVGTEDRVSIQQHLDSVRAVELSLSTLPANTEMCAPALGPTINSRRRPNFALVADLQLKMLVAALRCDVTRVATIQLANARGSDLSMDFVPGVSRRDGADWISIAQAVPSATGDRKRLVDRWFMALFAKLLAAMRATPAGTATLLDQSAVLWATTTSDGLDGSNQKLPWLLAGKCGGYFKTGQVADSAGKPLHGVLAELCNAMDTPVEFFADRTFGTPMPGLKA